jgi:hypothetical protein
MPSYNASHFDPPAPVARVTLRNPHSGATVSDVLLLLDTGADITLLPRTAVAPLGVPLLAGQQYEFFTPPSHLPNALVCREVNCSHARWKPTSKRTSTTACERPSTRSTAKNRLASMRP